MIIIYPRSNLRTLPLTLFHSLVQRLTGIDKETVGTDAHFLKWSGALVGLLRGGGLQSDAFTFHFKINWHLEVRSHAHPAESEGLLAFQTVFQPWQGGLLKVLFEYWAQVSARKSAAVFNHGL
jgi:hypothetical protein